MSRYLTRLQMIYSLALVTNFNKVLATIQMLRNSIYAHNTTTALPVPTFTELKMSDDLRCRSPTQSFANISILKCV